MAYQGISTGTGPNTGSGDSLLDGAVKINNNFTEIYNALGDGTNITLSKTRQINTGSGLSGGGDLTTDRTLSVDNSVIRTTGGQTITGSLTATTFSGNGTIPIGGIIMWSGSVASIPTGWALCNGTNGTPNLLDRFIVGAGSGYNPGVTGGANAVTLTTGQMPSHNHSDGTNSGSTNTTTNLNGSFATYTFESGAPSFPFTSSILNDNALPSGSGANNKNFVAINLSANHSHSIFVNAQGGGEAHENRPPYYALAFIMRTS